MSKRRRPKSVNGNRQSNLEPRHAGRHGQQSATSPQGPNESVIAQGPLAVTQSTAPVNAGEQGHAEASSLPSAAVTDVPSESEQHLTRSGDSPSGGVGEVHADSLILNPRGKRDLMCIQKLLESPNFQLPSQFYTETPKRLLYMAHGITNCANPPTDKNGNPSGWSQSAQLRAAAILERMDRSNKQTLVSAERLRQRRHKKPGLHLHQHEAAKVIIVLPHNGRDDPSGTVAGTVVNRANHG